MKNNILMTVDEETWEMLNKRKKFGESFNQVIKRSLMEIPETKKEEKNN